VSASTLQEQQNHPQEQCNYNLSTIKQEGHEDLEHVPSQCREKHQQ
jgi:hypothetical protein